MSLPVDLKERPIIFGAPEVRAVLEGRKMQARRVVNPQPRPIPLGRGILDAATCLGDFAWPESSSSCTISCNPNGPDGWAIRHSPYGQAGDRLWVQETWQGPVLDEVQQQQWYENGPEKFRKSCYCVYRATDTLHAIDEDGDELGWEPSIHMPRWASRIDLEVTGVRVERLNEISEADAIAEGVGGHFGVYESYDAETPSYAYAKSSFRSLWESINGAGSWSASPWVWVIEFKLVE